MFTLTFMLLTQLSFGAAQFTSPYVVLDEDVGGSASVYHSVSQLSAPSVVEFMYIPGDPVYDLTDDSNITDRNVCGDLSFVVDIPDPDSPLEVVLLVSWSGSGEPECNIEWGDGEVEEDEALDAAEVEFEHEYPKFGIYPIVITCQGDGGASRCPPDISECISTTNFLDDENFSFDTPLTFFTSEQVQINSYMQLEDSDCGTPVINWRIVHVNITELINITDYPPSDTSVLIIPPGVLEPGEYAVSLEISFPNKSADHYADDWLVMKIVLPELVTHIYGGEYMTVPYGGDIFIDATVSTDPADGLESLEDEDLIVTWTFLYYPLTPLFGFDGFMRQFPQASIPGGYKTYNIETGAEYGLQVGTVQFEEGKHAVVMFSLQRGDRESTAMQVIRFVADAVPVSIQCVYNCHVGRERLFYHDKVELNAKFPTGFDYSKIQYKWQYFIRGFLGIYWRQGLADNTGYETQGLNTITPLGEGDEVKITLEVSGPGYVTSKAELVRTVNFIPRVGTCLLSATVATAARDWVSFECIGWLGNDDRRNNNNGNDVNPILTYTIRQRTITAKVEEEPILRTRARRSHVILKVGNPAADFDTTLYVRVADMWGNYATVFMPMKSYPPFDTTAVKPTQAGSDLVASYTDIDYPFDEQQLRDMGKNDMTISLVSAVCSILHIIELPEWEPPVPRVLNDGGNLLDLSPAGNTDVGDMNEVMAAANNDTLDPATITIQVVVEKMTQLLRDVVQVTMIEGRRRGDTMLGSIITNAFTNIAAKAQYANFETQKDLIFLAPIVGFDSLAEQNTTKDRSAEIKAATDEIAGMYRSIVNSCVPDDLQQNRPVKNLLDSIKQIDSMMIATGANFSLNNSLISPTERAALLMQMQNKLRHKTALRKADARNCSFMAKDLAQNIQGKLKICSTCSNEDSTTTEQLVKKNQATVITRETTQTKTSQFKLDGLSNLLNERKRRRKRSTGDDLPGDAENVDVSAFELDENVYMYDTDGTSAYVSSNVLRVDVKAGDEQLNPGYMTFDQTVQTPDAETITPDVEEEDASEFMYHQFIYQKATDQVCVIVLPLGDDHNITQYDVYVRFTEAPSLLDYSFIFTVTEEDDWQECVTPDKMTGHTGLTYMAIHLPEEMKTVDYNLTLITVGCLTWDSGAEKWQTDKCYMDWVPEYNKISCYCNDITDMVFANSFFVAPNSIDFSSVFLKFSPLNQAAVMATLIGLFLIFIICVILLLDLDRKDQLKWGITPLRDNFICDKQYYLIKVLTGMRRGAGTKSRIAFILSGDKSTSGPRELFDGIREEFSTGGSLAFFMATGEDLGALEHLSIWHDNSGEDDYASWYLNQVVVYDLANRETYTFVAEQWLSVENGLELHLKSNPKNDPIKFESRFFYQTRDRLSESHMWVSIMYRPQTSTFTRVQRAGCALVYIMLNMIANAMYFNPSPNYQSPPLLQIGPFRFTQQQIFISLVCALLTTPPVMILILLFKRTKRKAVSPDTSCCSCCYKLQCVLFCKSLFRTRKGELRKQQEQVLRAKLLTPDVPDFSGAFYLPHWFAYVAWFIAFAAVVVSAFFIMLYSMEWGKQKSEEWLTAFFMSLVESMLFVDPITVICIAFVLACLIRSNKEDTNVDMVMLVQNYRRVIGEDEDTVKSSIKVLRSIKSDYTSYKSTPRNVTPPLQGDNLARAAEQHRLHVEMTSVLRDIIINIFFMLIVFSICFANRDDRSYYHREQIVNTIVAPSSSPQFESITRPGELFAWINDTVFPALFPMTDYEGTNLLWTDKEYTQGIHDLRLGPPRLRQVRANKGNCEIPYIGAVDCYSEYSISTEDERSYCMGWKPQPCPETEGLFNASYHAWQFTSAFDIWGLPLPGMYKTYGGGGYLATFDVSLALSRTILNELFQTLWINRQTRATMLEFTLYNPATNIFIYNIFMVEFPETGGAVTAYSVYPLRLYTHHGPTGSYTLFCEVILALLLIVMMVKICIRIYQQRCSYFSQFWQVYEIVIFVTGASAIGIFFIRLGLTSVTIDRFMENKKVFCNFSHIVLWDQVLMSLLSLLVFMATLRILQALGTTKKIAAIVKVFKNCGKDLFWYAMAFLYLFFGFCMLGMLLFGSHLENYMSMYQTMGMLFISMIGKSRFTDIVETQPLLAKIFFIFYILTVVFFVLTIFLSILGSSIDQVIHDTRVDEREDLIEFMMKQLRTLIIKPTNSVKKRRPKVQFLSEPKISMKYQEDETLEKFMNKEETSMDYVLELPKHPSSPKYKMRRMKAKMKRGKTSFVSE